MKNTIKLFGIIALVAVIGFSMAGCDMDESDTSTDGRLTITGLSSYNGGEITVSTDDNKVMLSTSNDFNTSSGTLNITGNSVTFYVWKPWIREGKSNLWQSYKGNDTILFYVGIRKQDDSYVAGNVTVTFVNGIGTGAFVPNP
jgi:hypothetical protein